MSDNAPNSEFDREDDREHDGTRTAGEPQSQHDQNNQTTSDAARWKGLGPLDQKRLLYQMSKWYVAGKSHSDIADAMKEWISRYASRGQREDGAEFRTSFVGNLLKEAAQEHGFLQLGRFYEEELFDRIQRLIKKSKYPKVNVVVAPDEEALLRYIWLDIEHLLREKVQLPNATCVLGVSGGRTMVDLADAAHHLEDLPWRTDEVEPEMRQRVTVCSLTSGGVRSNIGSLSDTVAALIAKHLEANAQGLLGPAWFANHKALRAFCDDPDVRNHRDLIDRADVIVTSVGLLKDSGSLMRHLLDQAELGEWVSARQSFADLLYNCYDGVKGSIEQWPSRVGDHLFTTIELGQLQQKVRKRQTRCFVLARGREKGMHAIPGLLRGGYASDLYMDRACAEGFLERVTAPAKIRLPGPRSQL